MNKFFVILILFFNYSTANIMKDASFALEAGDVQKAIKLYNEAARNGDTEANFHLGKIYYKGKYLKKDLEKAIKYFHRASLGGHIKSKYNMATIYSQKRYEKHNFRKAYNLFLDLARQGYPKAQNKVGIFLTYGFGIDKDYKLAVQWLEEAYFNGNYLPASCNLAFMFANGYGVFHNFGRASVLAKKGYENKLPMCVKVYEDFNLHKYKEDKGFKYGFYK